MQKWREMIKILLWRVNGVQEIFSNLGDKAEANQDIFCPEIIWRKFDKIKLPTPNKIAFNICS